MTISSTVPDGGFRQIDIPALIDRSKIGFSQTIMLVLCGLCLIVDGFDVQAMGYVAPAIIQDWGIAKSHLGPVFGAGLFGMLVGSLMFSMLADRIGRRPVLIAATLFFAVCMLVTPMATSLGELEIIRFITGLGLGAIMPNAMALAGEYSPVRKRVTLMMLVSCGFTLGAVLGGLLSAYLIPRFGWQSVFHVGGVVPLVIGALMIFLLPESMQFLVLRGKKLDQVGKWLRRIDPNVVIDAQTRYVVNEKAGKGAPMLQLFQEGRAKVTILLWVINFMNLVNLYFLSNWLPTIAKDAGLSTANAVLAGTALQIGGTFGTLIMGQLIDRSSFRRVLIPVFVVAGFAVALIGRPEASLVFLFGSIFVAGFCIVGGQPAVNALAGTYYPTTLRSTGIGWSLGIGRIGSIVGPVLGGELIRLNWPNSTIFIVLAVPALVSALMLILMGNSALRKSTVASSITTTSANEGQSTLIVQNKL
ncbi:aromatic acid/H+ symport family MFS transporter [Glaciimonas sp. PAMC28666]|uniref:MFS transporter n=1 Tax=Glaciimonas sp. PAMC28666 TaxID=2807626 RepID=UPI00196412AB|nr:aromatic acid/H+ symport family MFS transporter [Glaciimonas sp. PAMC28666]QRX81465.1 aromatic acid/H+ symport family MFS transporter [Glaciimonas sp. PAMC28666]